MARRVLDGPREKNHPGGFPDFTCPSQQVFAGFERAITPGEWGVNKMPQRMGLMKPANQVATTRTRSTGKPACGAVLW